MYTLKVYKVNQIDGQHDELLLKSQKDTLNQLFNLVKANGLGLGHMTVLEHVQASYDEIMLVCKTESGELVDFVFYKSGSNIKQDLIKSLRGER